VAKHNAQRIAEKAADYKSKVDIAVHAAEKMRDGVVDAAEGMRREFAEDIEIVRAATARAKQIGMGPLKLGYKILVQAYKFYEKASEAC